jgi:hypothetical protein
MAAAAIGTTRRAGLLAVAVGGTVFGGYRMYQREAEEMPAAAPPPGTLYAEAARRGDGATSCAVCAAVAPSSLGAVSHGSNYAKIDAATLLRGVAALEAGLDGEVVGPEAVSTSFGAERLVRRGTGSAWTWLGASAREPRWVGDEQSVVLWLAEPSAFTASPLGALEFLDAAHSRNRLRGCIEAMLRAG